MGKSLDLLRSHRAVLLSSLHTQGLVCVCLSVHVAVVH